MENLFPKIVRIYRLHSTALAIDKYWYNSVQFKLPSTFFQALDWQLWRSYGFKKYIFMFSVNVHKRKKRASKYRPIPRESKNRTPYNYMPITLPNVVRFSKFFHHRTQYKHVIKVSISPNLKHVATLPCEM